MLIRVVKVHGQEGLYYAVLIDETKSLLVKEKHLSSIAAELRKLLTMADIPSGSVSITFQPRYEIEFYERVPGQLFPLRFQKLNEREEDEFWNSFGTQPVQPI